MTTLCFIDTETTSLRHDRRAWEIAAIIRKEAGEQTGDDQEYTWLITAGDLDLGNADLNSLKIGRFHERHPGLYAPSTLDFRQLAHAARVHGEVHVLAQVEKLTRDAIIVGAVPWFDTEVIANRMRAHGICPSWHYHLVDVETLAAGHLKLAPPWDFDKILAAFGLTYQEEERHTALGDARMVARLYDVVMAAAPMRWIAGVENDRPSTAGIKAAYP
jgi:hypothetical protein